LKLSRLPLISIYLSYSGNSSGENSRHLSKDHTSLAKQSLAQKEVFGMHVNAKKTLHDKKPITNADGKKYH
jgi:hypothetical protein